jgi:hypothetical protein
MFDGAVTTGGVVTTTVTAKLAAPVLPCVSVAVHVTVVVPMANVLPDAGVHVTGSVPSTRSIADAVYATTAPLGPVAGAVMLGGTVTTGDVVLKTVTAKVALDLLPWASVAAQFTVVVPIANVAPEAGVHTGVIAPSTSSIAVGAV